MDGFLLRSRNRLGASTPMLVFNPVEELGTVEIRKEKKGCGNDRDNDGYRVLLIPDARSLNGQQISPGQAAYGRNDEKGREVHPTQAQNIA